MLEGKYFYLHDDLGILIGKCIRMVGTEAYEVEIYISKDEYPNSNIKYHNLEVDVINEILQLDFSEKRKLKIYDNYEELVEKNIIDFC